MKLEHLESKVDRRGTLVEAFKLPADGQVFYVIAEPGETRGNHYHLRKTEHFLVIYGSAEIQARDRSTDNVMKLVASGGDPIVATILPNTTHNITATHDGCIFMVWCDEIFNDEDADTYPEEI